MDFCDDDLPVDYWQKVEMSLLSVGYSPVIFETLRPLILKFPDDDAGIFDMLFDALLSFANESLGREDLLRDLVVKLKSQIDENKEICCLKTEKNAALAEAKKLAEENGALKQSLFEIDVERGEIREKITSIESQCLELRGENDKLKSQLADLKEKLSDSLLREQELSDRQKRDVKNFAGWREKKYEPAKQRLAQCEAKCRQLEAQIASLNGSAVMKKENVEAGDADELILTRREAGQLKDKIQQWVSAFKPLKDEFDQLKEKFDRASGFFSKLECSLIEHLQVFHEPFHFQMERSFLRALLRSIGDTKEALSLPRTESALAGESTSMNQHHRWRHNNNHQQHAKNNNNKNELFRPSSIMKKRNFHNNQRGTFTNFRQFAN